ncbi:MAG: hypothetical protein M9962_02475 [Oligoflexia bacterium]|nr:hypothetical protein [Oligoflexia bacterium]
MLFIITLLHCTISYSLNYELKGSIVLPEEDPKKIEYKLVSTRKDEAKKSQFHTQFLDTNNNPLVDERTTTENGKLVEYLYEQHQVNEKGSIRVAENKVIYQFFNKGKWKTETEDYEENMIVPDMIHSFLADHYEEIKKGETIKFRFLLLERMESIGFKFFLEEEKMWEGRKVSEVIMKPSSFFIALIAPSIHFYLDANPPHRVYGIKGRLPIRKAIKNPPENRGDWKAIDGLVKVDKITVEEKTTK